ncbi:phosphodiester glycosidase family protein [Marimonas lutisalis]|uniref:phosphodiester glycosidase family protein n=1 Tax=Marimonas lutisalis TaxID=2545756 RepID=UPI0018753AD8|nr:phosphodiester glycosidase family protein [Marimonas lutisalis]
MLRRVALALCALVVPAAAGAVDCRDIEHRDKSFTICEIDVTQETLRLFLKTPQGDVIGHFGALEDLVGQGGQRLAMAMNAGMYHEDRTPVGLFIEDGVEKMRLVTSAGPGNFGLLPNGVFCIRDGRADVIETRRYAREAPECRFATQSGPMLVIDGALHPRFLPDSTSRYVRNGVGSTADGRRVVFAISNTVVTFHEFGTLFRDVLKLPNALFFDGNISRLFARDIGRSDAGFTPLGPMVAVVE